MQVSIKKYYDSEDNRSIEVATVYPNINDGIAHDVVKRLNTQAGHKYINEYTFIPLAGKCYYMIDP